MYTQETMLIKLSLGKISLIFFLYLSFHIELKWLALHDLLTPRLSDLHILSSREEFWAVLPAHEFLKKKKEKKEKQSEI